MIKSIISVIFIGAAIAVFVWYVKPTYDATLSNRTKIVHFDKALETMRLAQKRTNSLLSQLNNSFTKSDLIRLKKMLPDNVNNVRLVLDIDSMAKRYGVQIKNVQIQKPQDATPAEQSGTVLTADINQNLPYKIHSLQFDVVATYSDFLLLLRDMESSLRIVDIVKLNVRPINTNKMSSNGILITSTKPYYTFSVALRTYSLR